MKPPRLGVGECGPCPNFVSYTLAFALQLRKITENLSQGIQKALGLKAPNAICLVDLALAGDGLLAPATLRFRVRRRGQPSVSVSICRVAVLGGSPHQLTELKLAVRALMWSANNGTPRSSYLPVTYVPGGTSSKAHPSSQRCPRRREWRRGCMGWWLECPVQRSDRSSRRRNHVGVFPVSWSAASSSPRVWC